MRLWRIALSLLVCGLLPLPGYAGLDEIRRDAEKGDSAAQYEMGILYEFGFNLADREVEALAWYMAAAERGSKQAIGRRDLLLARLTSDQRSRAEARSREILASLPAPAPVPVEPEAPAAAAAPTEAEPAAPAEEPVAAPAEEPAPAP